MTAAPTDTAVEPVADVDAEPARPWWRELPPVALLAVAALLGVTWALVTPAFQAPDENAHFGYVQTLVETGELPGDPAKLPYSTEQDAGMSVSNSNQTAAARDTKMEWSRPVWEQWLAGKHPAQIGVKRDDSGGLNPAASNPPLYYLYESLGYRAASSGNLFAQLTLMRLLSVVWILVAVAAAWLLACEVFARDRLVALAAAGLVALAPMVTFVSSSLSPDAMLIAAWTLVLWLGVRILRRGLTPASAAVFLAVVGAATVVKATSYALLPSALLVLAVGLHRRRPLPVKRLATIVAAAGAGLAATAGAWYVIAGAISRPAAAQISAASTTAGTDLPRLVSYLWQYYLPRLPGMDPFPTAADFLPAYDVWFKGVWFQFGWTEVVLRNRYYLLVLAITLVIVAAAASELWRRRATGDKMVGAFIAVVTLSLLAGLHWSDYRLIQGGGSFAQGRYLLPLVGVAGVVLGLGIRRLAPERRGVAVAAVLGSLFVVQAVALTVVVQRFYA